MHFVADRETKHSLQSSLVPGGWPLLTHGMVQWCPWKPEEQPVSWRMAKLGERTDPDREAMA